MMSYDKIGKNLINWLKHGLLLPVVFLFTLFLLVGCGAAADDGSTTIIMENSGTTANVTEDSGMDDTISEDDSIVDSISEDDSMVDSILKESSEDVISEDGVYTSKEDVALYIHTYGTLPDNFITKKEARSLGWSGGSLEPYAPGKCIGGDRFGNYEGNLPEGKQYTECDIDTLGADSRGAKRIVFSLEGQIYYTEDHYETFELLYE